jgi:DNA-binding XRE family transcriptional regulator
MKPPPPLTNPPPPLMCHTSLAGRYRPNLRHGGVVNKAKTPWLFSPCLDVLLRAMATDEEHYLQQLAREFGRRVRERRLQLDLTQEAASVATGISVTTYQKIENGHRMPRLENIVKLLRGLSMDPSELLSGLGRYLPSPDEVSWPGRKRRRRLDD